MWGPFLIMFIFLSFSIIWFRLFFHLFRWLIRFVILIIWIFFILLYFCFSFVLIFLFFIFFSISLIIVFFIIWRRRYWWIFEWYRNCSWRFICCNIFLCFLGCYSQPFLFHRLHEIKICCNINNPVTERSTSSTFLTHNLRGKFRVSKSISNGSKIIQRIPILINLIF